MSEDPQAQPEIIEPLTMKRAQFALEYIKDFNGTQAAIRAGYAKSGASVEGARLLAMPSVFKEITRLQAERAARTSIDADWVLERLAEEALADLGDIFDDDGELLPITEWPMIWRQGLVAGIEVEELFAGRGESRALIGRVRKIKLSDRIKRIELIGKHIGVQAFREQVGLGSPDGGPLQVTDARGRIAERLAQLAGRAVETKASG